jgi:hypothetical protein
MIDALDAMDAPAEDLEENDQGGDEHDGREPDVDEEPSLGSFDRMTDQRKSWRVYGRFGLDCEHKHDGREPDADGEEGRSGRGCGRRAWSKKFGGTTNPIPNAWKI